MGFRDAIDSLQHCVCGKEHRLKLLVEVSEEAYSCGKAGNLAHA